MRSLRAERVALDVSLGVFVLVAGLWRDVLRGEGTDFLLPISPTLAVSAHAASAAVLVVLRRSRPGVAAALLAGLSLLVPSYAALVIPYSLTRYGRRLSVSAAWAAVTVAGWSTGADLWREGDPLSGPLVAGALAVAGAYSRARSEALEALARQERITARAAERRQVAADLHDAVTHWVSLVVTQAGALAVRTGDPDLRSEVEGIRMNGTRAMEELQAMVVTLSDPTAVHARPRPEPFDAVIAHAVAAGQDVTTRWLGPAIVEDDAAGMLTAVVREALVNARRHAPGAAVAVHVAVRGSAARLLVRNGPADEGVHGPPRAGAGTGLAELSGRLAARGGTISTGPTPEGGFEVDVRLPLTLSGAAP